MDSHTAGTSYPGCKGEFEIIGSERTVLDRRSDDFV